MSNPDVVLSVHNLPAVADYLRSGAVLAYPSESVWGLGCDAFNTTALKRVIALKNRQLDKGLIVLTDNAERLLPLFANVSHETAKRYIEQIQQQTEHFVATHQRAVTWLIEADLTQLPKELLGGFATLAVRITPHPVLQSLCQNLVSKHNPYGFLVSTSCNLASQPPAQTLLDAYGYFADSVAYLDTNNLGFVQPSCIIELATGKVLR